MSSAVTPPVRLGVVGCGFVAERVHLPVLGRLPEVQVVAVCDRDPKRLESVAERFGVASRHSDAGSLIAEPSVEAVGVFVPPAEHVPPATAALEAGKHVLVEKPLALSAEDVDRLAAVLRELADDPDQGRRLGAAAASDVRARFGLRQMLDAVEDRYERLLTGGRGRRAPAMPPAPTRS